MQKSQVPFSNFPQNFNNTMQIHEPTYDQHIMKPPELNVTYGRIPDRLVIDSRDRNCNKYPNSNNYVYPLNKEYKNVVSIELVAGCVPYTGYIINKNNNKLFFQESFGHTLVAEVTPGNYNTTDLTTALQNALNDVGDNVYTVTINDLTNKFTISSNLATGDNIFRLLNNCCECSNSNNTICADCDSCALCRKKNCNKYIHGSISKKIGFDKVNFLFAKGIVTSLVSIDASSFELNACDSKFTEEFVSGENISFPELQNILFTIISVNDDSTMILSGTTEHVADALTELNGSKIYANKYTSNFIYDLEDEKYIILDIEHLENLDSNNKNIDNAFGAIYFVVPHGQNNIIVNGGLPRRGIEKYYNPPLATLDRLRIRFLTADGDLYDFNGRDHVLEFEIRSLNQPGKYDTLITY